MRLALCAGVVLALAMRAVSAAPPADDDARQYVAFVEDFVGTCVSRNGVQIQVKNTHPTRKLRVWLDRYHMGSGTGDRSRSVLLPGAEPEPLGCSRTGHGTQEWRIVRAVFID
ncbi:hypothetical protein [uncultured Methylibium sp.]|uniref:hypothetical protein n=1 Tax=uncultured Methylibium sp. TaxID=381093 RepID=UPI0025EE79A2|nr:hypothetical protein [uncultured Methylibium sp.]